MALSITAANVALVDGGNATLNKNFNAGATITAGQLVYFDETTSKWKLADANASALTSVIGGIAMNGASDGQPLAVATSGTIAIGATVTVGEIYVASATAGTIDAESELAQNSYVSIVAVGVTSARIKLCIFNSGVTIP